MAEKKYCIKTETLAGFAKALGHPARIAIMKFLAKQNTCYFGDIHEELPIAKATVSQHLSALKDAGLIQGEIETPKVKYCMNRENWAYAQQLFSEFFNMELCEKKEDCCKYITLSSNTLFDSIVPSSLVSRVFLKPIRSLFCEL